jgi:hypothetical protein
MDIPFHGSTLPSQVGTGEIVERTQRNVADLCNCIKGSIRKAILQIDSFGRRSTNQSAFASVRSRHSTFAVISQFAKSLAGKCSCSYAAGFGFVGCCAT